MKDGTIKDYARTTGVYQDSSGKTKIYGYQARIPLLLKFRFFLFYLVSPNNYYPLLVSAGIGLELEYCFLKFSISFFAIV